MISSRAQNIIFWLGILLAGTSEFIAIVCLQEWYVLFGFIPLFGGIIVCQISDKRAEREIHKPLYDLLKDDNWEKFFDEHFKDSSYEYRNKIIKKYSVIIKAE